ncbi:uncharacterized protein LOC141855025 [Brevipalpus obovatus]|uniref:uncharacterized protein LOC141855025 n=1 Tax=Brevipalpus obovatus TaxID=246614 RepID=UPI003D9E3A60
MSVHKNNFLLQLLHRISNGFVAITDNVRRDGLILFRKFLQSAVHDKSTHVLLLENNAKFLGISDIVGTLSTHSLMEMNLDLDQNLINYIQSLPSGSQLFIDSLLPLVLLHRERFFLITRQLLGKFRRIICLVNPKTLSPVGMSLFKEISVVFVEMSDSEKDTHCVIINKHPTKGIVKIREPYSVSESGDFICSASDHASLKNRDSNTFDIGIENLPFSLRSDMDIEMSSAKTSLKETMKRPIKDDPTSNKKEARFFYLPGKEDDVDEEDPDEDLLF